MDNIPIIPKPPTQAPTPEPKEGFELEKYKKNWLMLLFFALFVLACIIIFISSLLNNNRVSRAPQNPQTAVIITKPAPTISLETQYQNPFDATTTAEVNPFSTTTNTSSSNPFDKL